MESQVEVDVAAEKGQKNALGVLGIVMVAGLIVILAGVGIIAGVPAIPLGSVVGLILAAVMIFGKFY
ncbi:MAG TPA: hypothetical protein VMW83_12915 [Spirochaetia bacterium]|nr:hypothetical protein [Spirochaetia bacterium]